MSKSLLELSYSTATSFQPLAPPNVVLRPFQRSGVEYLLRVKRGLCADLMGMGKTPTAIATMNTAKVSQYLVIAPASLLDNWKREIERWNSLDKAVHIYRTGKKTPRDCILVLSYGMCSNVEILKRLLANYKFEGLICDESHYLAGRESLRTRNVLGIGGPFDRAEYICCLSGTPAQNRPVEIFPVASRLNSEALGFRTFREFGQYFAEEKRNAFTGRIEYVGSRNEHELGRRLRSSIMVRRDKASVLKDLPPKTRRAIYLDTDDAVESLVSREALLYDDFLAGKKLDLDRSDSAMRVRVQLAILKTKQVIEYAKMILTTEEKICIFGMHRQLLTEVFLGLAKYNPRVISGATNPKNRQGRVDDFQNDPSVRVFVGSVQAAGVGITLTASSYSIHAEASWVPGENIQAEDRQHRIGQRNHVICDYLIYPRSVDEKVLCAIGDKASKISLCLDSGGDYAN